MLIWPFIGGHIQPVLIHCRQICLNQIIKYNLTQNINRNKRVMCIIEVFLKRIWHKSLYAQILIVFDSNSHHWCTPALSVTALIHALTSRMHWAITREKWDLSSSSQIINRTNKSYWKSVAMAARITCIWKRVSVTFQHSPGNI